MDLREIGSGVSESIGLAQDRTQRRAFAETVMNHQVP
jgi:hypothetical protein